VEDNIDVETNTPEIPKILNIFPYKGIIDYEAVIKIV
jgi:hypothetical protein